MRKSELSASTQKEIVKRGFLLLQQHFNYKQIEVVRKMQFLEFDIGKSSFSNILNDRQAGPDVIWNAFHGIVTIVQKELGYPLIKSNFSKQVPVAWEAKIIPEWNPTGKIDQEGFHFYEEGRWEVGEKVDFFSNATSELIEVGVTLNTFSSYLVSRKKNAFKTHLIELMKKGVKLQCYLLDPECNEARIYFNDRAKILEEEMLAVDKIKMVLRRLTNFHRELDNLHLTDQLEVYTYRNIPSNYFFVVDPHHFHQSKMLVSHYLYGQPRAYSPVVEIIRKQKRELFKLYWDSFQLLRENARRVEL